MGTTSLSPYWAHGVTANGFFTVTDWALWSLNREERSENSVMQYSLDCILNTFQAGLQVGWKTSLNCICKNFKYKKTLCQKQKNHRKTIKNPEKVIKRWKQASFKKMLEVFYKYKKFPSALESWYLVSCKPSLGRGESHWHHDCERSNSGTELGKVTFWTAGPRVPQLEQQMKLGSNMQINGATIQPWWWYYQKVPVPFLYTSVDKMMVVQCVVHLTIVYIG